ncbi:glycosyltransferase family 2 protein [Autumnicola edwardsiae]|uniref:Glycosyltransferase family 2 protein n=1 Tax=Autumnicola edwardsiae TaxID=3075594 RepID=A0ABU3CR86_9FLAO|nr:glycosyltransferase family 2 protein [Zunongwangia sp. F297]MDT0648855.1 glycosyltransferase family 2 protein [Zunongwangia sp. F297]
MKNEKIYILIPTYNRAQLLLETLESVRNQTYSFWECIIVDDHSSDDTVEQVRKYSERDKRFSCFLRAEDYCKGPSGSRNMALDIAKERKAQFIQFFDDDDLMHPKKLELQVTLFVKDTDLELSICRYERFSSSAKMVPIDHIELINTISLAEDFLFTRLRLNVGGPLFRAKLFEDERFDESLQYGEEKELFLRILFRYRPKSLVLNQTLFYYRAHEVSLTRIMNSRILKRGSEIVIHQKIWDYLAENDLLNNQAAGFLIRQFLLENHSKEYINKANRYISKESNFSFFSKLRFRVLIGFHEIYSRIIYKLLLIKI